MKVRRSMLKDTVSVETYSGEAAKGPLYSAAVSVACNVYARRRLVVKPSGDQTVSELTLFVHPDDQGKFTPESRVTFQGRVSRVLDAVPVTMRGYTVAVKVACS